MCKFTAPSKAYSVTPYPWEVVEPNQYNYNVDLYMSYKGSDNSFDTVAGRRPAVRTSAGNNLFNSLP